MVQGLEELGDVLCKRTLDHRAQRGLQENDRDWRQRLEPCRGGSLSVLGGVFLGLPHGKGCSAAPSRLNVKAEGGGP